MGDRASVLILHQHGDDEHPGVFLYSHWGGLLLHEVVAAGVANATGRFDDEDYFTRIVIAEVEHNSHLLGAGPGTGLGIGTTLCSGEYELLVLDPATQRAWLAAETEWGSARDSDFAVSGPVSFDELVREEGKIA